MVQNKCEHVHSERPKVLSQTTCLLRKMCSFCFWPGWNLSQSPPHLAKALILKKHFSTSNAIPQQGLWQTHFTFMIVGIHKDSPKLSMRPVPQAHSHLPQALQALTGPRRPHRPPQAPIVSPRPWQTPTDPRRPPQAPADPHRPPAGPEAVASNQTSLFNTLQGLLRFPLLCRPCPS